MYVILECIENRAPGVFNTLGTEYFDSSFHHIDEINVIWLSDASNHNSYDRI